MAGNIALGLYELNSIAKGIETADRMVKAAEITLIQARSVCPGKFTIVIHGQVGAVQSSMRAAEACGGAHAIDSIVIPSLHPQVIEAITACSYPEKLQAIGCIEYFSIAAAVIGADAAAKAGNISLIEARLGTGIGGKSYVTLTGDVSAVRTAVEAGSKRAREQGMLVETVVIPSPRQEIFDAIM